MALAFPGEDQWYCVHCDEHVPNGAACGECGREEDDE